MAIKKHILSWQSIKKSHDVDSSQWRSPALSHAAIIAYFKRWKPKKSEKASKNHQKTAFEKIFLKKC